MRKIVAVMFLASCVLLGGCSPPINYDITDQSVAISIQQDTVLMDSNDPDDAGYQIITLDNRDYILYGGQGKTLTGNMIGACIAYDSQDSNDRFYKVIGSDDFIAEYYVIGEMEQFSFLRAVDTIGKDIDIPDFIDVFSDYNIWN